MDVIGYVLALVIGIVMGLLGSGGSVLSMPVLVYLMGISATEATAYSLFIVGTTSLFGCVKYLKSGLVSVKTVFAFAIPSLVAVYFTRKYLMDMIPEVVTEVGAMTITKDIFLMGLFALLMLGSALSMIFVKFKEECGSDEVTFNYVTVALEGIIVGILTGLVGAGGGFIIIPTLVLLIRLPMRLAVGTSLLIIAVKSPLGMIGDLQNGIAFDWELLIIFTSLSIIGILSGFYISKYIKEERLKPIFGWFVLLMGIFIIYKEYLNSLT